MGVRRQELSCLHRPSELLGSLVSAQRAVASGRLALSLRGLQHLERAVRLFDGLEQPRRIRELRLDDRRHVGSRRRRLTFLGRGRCAR